MSQFPGHRISIIGSGYVGLVTGTCFAEMGYQVCCMDIDAARVARLQDGQVPIYEPGLEEMLRRNLAAGRLQFTASIAEAVGFGEVIFIAVGTPPDEDGSSDLRHVIEVARDIGRYLDSYKVVVDKSTVPVGTADKVKAIIEAELAARGLGIPFSVVSNPEFLKEGAAIGDFMRPDRIVLGVDDERATGIMRRLYEPFQRNHERMLVMSVRSAELTKYAANAMLATRISFMNELANLAEQLDADIEDVRKGIGSDPRIGYHFLYPGIGYGGSCFPKDVKALIATGQERGQTMRMLQAAEEVNRRQKHRLVDKVLGEFGDDLHGRRFAMWGLAFKPNTDDMREAPSLVIIDELLQRGAAISVFDPVAMPHAQQLLAKVPGVSFVPDMMAALAGADALLIVTEWKAFWAPDFDAIKRALKQPVIFDGRNMYAPQLLRAQGFTYHAIGR
jgi:UDPglucose 6-dehydrogenase